MDLTPGVIAVVVVIVALGLVLLRWTRRHEAAAPIDAPATPVRSSAMAATADGANHALVNWLLDRASEQTGTKVADDPLARQRIVEAAAKATEELRTHGSATVNLPFLTADASGPKHFSVAFKRNPGSTFELQH